MIETYVKIINGKISNSTQIIDDQYINDFEGTWVEKQDGFYEGDLWDEHNGFITYIKTQEELETEARIWRDNEIQYTDFIVPLTDYPTHAATLTYRQELRDWPSTEEFPNTKPTKP